MIKRSDQPASPRRLTVTAVFTVALGLAMGPHAAWAACATPFGCTGDCNNSGAVTVDKILTTVNIALGSADVSQCPAGDANCDGSITVDEILSGVNNALDSCPAAVSGNGKLDAGEDCDVGGICIGGTNAGTACTSEAGCQGTGVCLAGTKQEFVCAVDADCPGSKCVHCVTFGGRAIPNDLSHTCAANCTFEQSVAVKLEPGDGLGHGSGAIVHSELVPGQVLPIPLSGTQTLVIGKARNGIIPLVIPASSVQFPQVDVGGAFCACVRGVAQMTCGGTLFEANGLPATICTPLYTVGDSVCTAVGKPCAFVNGVGNSASGVIGCAGLSGVNLTYDEDSQRQDGNDDPVICDATSASFNPPDPRHPVCGQPPAISFAGQGGAGSATLLNTTAIGKYPGLCSGAPAAFCTYLAPASLRGQPQTLPLVTGTAGSEMLNANGDAGNTIGPVVVSGHPLNSCDALENNQDASGLTLAGAFASLSQPSLYDIVTTNVQIFQKP